MLKNRGMQSNLSVRWNRLCPALILMAALFAACCGCRHVSPGAAGAKPPKGFTALFNGKDLTGWRGGDTFDHRKLLAMPAEQREAQIAKWTETMKAHWRAENGELVNDGQGAYATTEKDYGDFELLLEYKTVPKADSGIYLRGCPQVQIWDYTEKAKFTDRRRQGLRRALEQQPRRARQGPARAGGQAVRRMELSSACSWSARA